MSAPWRRARRHCCRSQRSMMRGTLDARRRLVPGGDGDPRASVGAAEARPRCGCRRLGRGAVHSLALLLKQAVATWELPISPACSSVSPVASYLLNLWLDHGSGRPGQRHRGTLLGQWRRHRDFLQRHLAPQFGCHLSVHLTTWLQPLCDAPCGPPGMSMDPACEEAFTERIGGSGRRRGAAGEAPCGSAIAMQK